MTITLVGHEPPRLDYSTQAKLTYSLRNDLVLAVFNFLYCCFLRIAPQFFLFLSSSKTTPKKFQNAARGSELGVNTQLPIVHRSTHTQFPRTRKKSFPFFFPLQMQCAACRKWEKEVLKGEEASKKRHLSRLQSKWNITTQHSWVWGRERVNGLSNRNSESTWVFELC